MVTQIKIISTFIFFIILITFCTKQSLAQDGWCGTMVTLAQIIAERSQAPVQRSMIYQPNKCLDKTLSVTAYIVRDSLGQDGITQAVINAAMQVVNADFAPICLSFEVCQFIYIDNYNFNNYIGSRDEPQLRTLHYIPKTINMYFVKSLQVTPGVFRCGYAYFPGGLDIVVIQKSCASSLKTISHELGHFFGLYHTFETQFGAELVNESNCVTGGDLMCDTPADPGTANGADCQLNPYTMDSNGQWYVPDIGNIMSYYSDACKCGFTTDQFNKMAFNFLNNRNYLW